MVDAALESDEDEKTIIEKRRQKRLAILAKYEEQEKQGLKPGTITLNANK